MTGSEPTVVFWNNIPSPYLVGRLNTLVGRVSFQFEAWFTDRSEPDRSWEVVEHEWAFPYQYLGGGLEDGTLIKLRDLWKRLGQVDVLVCLHSNALFALGSLMAKLRGVKVVYRILPTFDTWVKRTWYKEWAKHFLFRVADGAIVPGPAGKARAQAFGMKPDRVYQVTQSIDIEHFSSAQSLSSYEREQKRHELGLEGTVFVYVGRLWRGKGVHLLIEAYRQIVEASPLVSLLLIGDGVDESDLRRMSREVPRVVFAGFLQYSQLPQFLALSDVFVFPTLGDPHGLVVEEAMAAGLPVITSEAAGDIHTRVLDGENGFVVPPRDVDAMAQRMMQLAKDPNLRKAMAVRGWELVRTRDHGSWARDFDSMIGHVA